MFHLYSIHYPTITNNALAYSNDLSQFNVDTVVYSAFITLTYNERFVLLYSICKWTSVPRILAVLTLQSRIPKNINIFQSHSDSWYQGSTVLYSSSYLHDQRLQNILDLNRQKPVIGGKMEIYAVVIQIRCPVFHITTGELRQP